jgi:hypothetical protein
MTSIPPQIEAMLFNHNEEKKRERTYDMKYTSSHDCVETA